MRLAENIWAGGPWATVALVQVTLVALLGILAWLAAWRAGPALRGAVLLAALVGLVLVPVLAMVAPVWLPLPEFAWLAGAAPTPADPSDGVLALRPAPPENPAVYAIVVTQPAAKAPPGLDDPAQKTSDATMPGAKAEAFLIDLPVAPEENASPARFAEPKPASRGSWGLLGGLLALVWLLGALAFLLRALLRLAWLHRCARRARPVHDAEWTVCLQSLAERHGLAAVALRESSAIASPLTLGLRRPVILLPRSRRGWSAEQRTLILEHELAHVRRRDFLTGLLAELAACLCWLHPLVHWLVGRLRLEQEYAADAWAASATTNTRDYLRCLARLALELSQGRGSLAPALWRRRPEILRRIDMLRRNPTGLSPRLPRQAAWMVAALTTAACLAVAGVGPLRSAPRDQKPTDAGAEAKGRATADLQEDPLPAGALARLGTTRLRHAADVTFVAFGPDGKTLLTAGQDNTIRLWDLASGKEIRRFARPQANAPRPPRKGEKAGDNEVKIEDVMVMMAAGGNSGSFRVALAPDGKTLAAASGNIIQLWEVATGKELRQIQGLPNGAAGLLFSPDSKTLAARGPGGVLYLWEADTGKAIHQLKPPPRPKQDGIVLVFGGGGDGGADAPGMAFLPDSKVLAAAATETKEEAVTSSVKFWDVATGKEIRQIKAPEGVGVSSVAVARSGKLLAYGGGNVVHLCEADTGKEVRQIKTPDNGILSLVFSPDGKTLAVRGRNQRVRLWETESGKELQQLTDAEPPRQTGGLVLVANNFAAPETRALAISPDGKQIASAAGSTVRLWDLASGKELPLQGGHWRSPTAIILQDDSKTVVTWGADRVVRRWGATDGKPLGAFPAPPRTTRAALSADGQAIALANGDNTIRIHETATGKELHRLKGPQGGVSALAFAPDGKVLAARANGNTIYLYDTVQGTELKQINVRPTNNPNAGNVIILGGPPRGARGTGPGVAFSPDGKLVVIPVSGGNNPGNALVFFDVATGKELRKIQSPQPVASFAFAPDGRSLATENADRTITLWEVASGKEQGQFGKAVAERPQQGGGAMALAVAVDGFSGGFNEPSGPVGVAFSPDGQALAVRTPDRQVRIFDVTAGKEIGQLKGHAGRIETVAFSRDSKTLASGSGDTTILLWDAAAPLKDLAKPQAIELKAAEVEALWGTLASGDAAKALGSVRKLAAAPGQALPFLAERLKPAVRVDPKKIDGWIADLDSEKLAVRQEAATNLLKVGVQAVPALRKVLASGPQLETRKRVEELVDKLTGGTLTAEQLRLVRAVEALERMGTPEARKLLQTLAEGAPGELPTQEAQAALVRLK